MTCSDEWRTAHEYKFCQYQKGMSPKTLQAVASPLARICCEEGQSWKLGHGALTANFRAGCSICSMTVTIGLQYWSKRDQLVQMSTIHSSLKELWVVDICTSWSRRPHNTWIVGWHITPQSELKIELLEVEGAQYPIAGDTAACKLYARIRKWHFTFSSAAATRSLRFLPVAVMKAWLVWTVKLTQMPTPRMIWIVVTALSVTPQKCISPVIPTTTLTIDTVTHATGIGCGMNTRATNSIPAAVPHTTE